MADEINDAKLLNLANERMEKIDISQAIPTEDVYKKLGITEEDLADCKDVNIEWTGKFNIYRKLKKIYKIWMVPAGSGNMSVISWKGK